MRMNLSTPAESPASKAFLWGAGVLLIAAAGGALAALAVTLWLLGHPLQPLERGTNSEELQILWQLEAEWDSEAMIDRRAEAGSALLEQRGAVAVEEILRFLDEVGYVVRKYEIDQELVWYRLYWPVVCYWKASEFLRRTEPRGNLQRYVHLRSLVDALQAVEQQRFGASGRVGPTPDQVRDFLLNEARGRSRGEDGGEASDEPAYMTPL
ncbi:MAG: hypothetical protein N3C12_07995 [Candidatus Binatia bacterium]|nr:hypothetical protein [Candidatus Binatia bacterium]